MKSSFLTITITSAPKIEPLPGDYDPDIALHLFMAESAAREGAPRGSDLRLDYARRSLFFQEQSKRMRRGDTISWWDVWQGSERMSYECDAALGSLAIADCTQIQAHQIGPLNETFEIGPGKSKFLSSSQRPRCCALIPVLEAD